MFHRMRLVLVSIVVAACQSAGSPTAAPTTGATIVAAATPTIVPATVAPQPTKPLVMPRTVDVALDGTCESGGPGCLGKLEAGKVYTTTTFKPVVSFMVPSGDWDNPNEAGGEMPIFSTTDVGDVIFFFSHAHSVDPTVGGTFDEIVAWLQAYDQISVTPPTPVKIGGLTGVTMDVRASATAVNSYPDCPVQVCVAMLRGDDTVKNDPYQWHWDWGPAGTEIMRLNLLNANGNTVVVLADSVDGLTFDKITAALDAMAPTIKFDLTKT